MVGMGEVWIGRRVLAGHGDHSSRRARGRQHSAPPTDRQLSPPETSARNGYPDTRVLKYPKVRALAKMCGTYDYRRRSEAFHEVWESERFQTADVTFKIVQGHWRWYHSIGHIRFPISIHLSLYIVPFPGYYHLFPKI